MKSINEIIASDDGSDTLISKRFGEGYHSKFGAVQESKHIFINAALKYVAEKLDVISILEVGFGTGLNALLSYKFGIQHDKKISYIGIEAFPVEKNDVEKLNYPEILNIDKSVFLKMHAKNDKEIKISDKFTLTVFENTLQNTNFPENFFDIVYFDAFSPETQPEMWQESCFRKIYNSLKNGGVLSTYSSKGDVKRALKAAGFIIEKLSGPPGKREFLRALKV